MRILPLLVFLAACGGAPRSYCNAKVTCADGDEQDFDRCVDDKEDDYEEADRKGCAGEFDRWVDCAAARGECEGDRWKVDDECDEYEDEFEACEDD